MAELEGRRRFGWKRVEEGVEPWEIFFERRRQLKQQRADLIAGNARRRGRTRR